MSWLLLTVLSIELIKAYKSKQNQKVDAKRQKKITQIAKQIAEISP